MTVRFAHAIFASIMSEVNLPPVVGVTADLRGHLCVPTCKRNKHKYEVQAKFVLVAPGL
jgi:hypothetical protein